MTTFSPAGELRGPSWLLDVLVRSALGTRCSVLGTPHSQLATRHSQLDWWHWVVLSLGCVSGCASWDQIANNAPQPLRATGNLLARTNDRVGDLFESHSTRHRNPANLPAHQAPARELASPAAPLAKGPLISAAAQAGAISLPISKPTATQAIHNTPAAPEKPRESQSVPAAPPAVELLPAPPADVQPIAHSRPVAAKGPATSSPTSSGITTWCRVRIRNVSQQAVSQVAVTVNSPENATLVSRDGDTVSAPVRGKMDFAPVAQVGSHEEVILVIGVGTSEQRGNRLRVQVRDGLGGSNHDVQARWQVAIEALE